MWVELGTGAQGHQHCHHVTAVVETHIEHCLTGGDWDSPGEII